MPGKLTDLDEQIFLAINQHHSLFFDKLMWQISGNLIWLPLYAFLIFILVKNLGKAAIWPVLGAIIAVGLADFTSVHLFKETFHRLRPCHNPELQNIVHIVNNHCGGKYGFISSHASNTFALATFLALVIRKRYITIILLLWASLVAFSRIYLGVHYPADVIGGAIWGSLIGALVFYLLKKLKPELTTNSN